MNISKFSLKPHFQGFVFVFWIFISLHRYASQNKAREAVVVFYHTINKPRRAVYRVRKCNSFAEAARLQKSLAAGCIFMLHVLNFLK